MPSWEDIEPWVMLGIVIVAIWLGRRSSARKAERLKAEGGRAALAAHLQQQVNVDARRVEISGGGAANDGTAAIDGAAIDRAVQLHLARLLAGNAGHLGLDAGVAGAGLGDGSATYSAAGDAGSSLVDDAAFRVRREPTLAEMVREPWIYDAANNVYQRPQV